MKKQFHFPALTVAVSTLYIKKGEENVIVEEGENKEPVFYNYSGPNLNLTSSRKDKALYLKWGC